MTKVLGKDIDNDSPDPAWVLKRAVPQQREGKVHFSLARREVWPFQTRIDNITI